MNRDENAEATFASKPRGRPRKRSPDKLQGDKRARGRQAQKSFHQRKQADAARLTDRISLLEDALEKMSNEFIDFGDRLISSTTAPSEPQILHDLRLTTTRFLDIARTTEPSSGDREYGAGAASSSKALEPQVALDKWPLTEAPTSSADTTLQDCLEIGLKPPIPSAPSPLFSAVTPLPHKATTSNLSYVPDIVSAASGRFSPRLNYGILAHSPFQASVAENLWSQYLIAGPNSFAMRLYVDALALIVRVLRGEVSSPGFLSHICRYRFRHEKPGLLLGILDNQLSKMSLDDQMTPATIGPPSPSSPETALVLFGPSDPLMSNSLRKQSFRDISQDMGSVRGWLDPWHTQQYLSGQWGIQLTSLSAQVSTQTLRSLNNGVPGLDSVPIPPSPSNGNSSLFEDYRTQRAAVIDKRYMYSNSNSSSNESILEQDAVRNFSQSNVLVTSQPLIETLVRDALCFGEGPRFYQDNIDTAAMAFLSGIASTEVSRDKSSMYFTSL